MNSAARLELIKSKSVRYVAVQTKPKGLHAPKHPDHISKARRLKLVPRCDWYGWKLMVCEGGFSEARNVDWVRKPTKKRKKPMGHNERHDPHYLNKIAEKLKGLKRSPAPASSSCGNNPDSERFSGSL